ncbi:MAG: glycerophosphoryl diester phosphodiesterase [Bacterioplanes sp.]|nr:glycerophosphoryl diester phosphodiesterase [Bacterioplanes sp.]
MPSYQPYRQFSAYHHLTPVIAHRGASGIAPENTAAAIKLAAEQGVQWAEVDVTISADGIAVIHHDSDLARCSNGHGLVILKRLAELKELDCGNWFSPHFRGERMMTLTELLALANQFEMALNLEVKPIIGRETETVWAIYQALQRVPFEHPLILSSFSIHALQACRAHLPDISRGLNVEAIPQRWQDRIEEADCQGLHFSQAFFDANQVQQIKQSGIHLLSYTVNDLVRAEQLWQAGINSVFTDFPARLLESHFQLQSDRGHH